MLVALGGGAGGEWPAMSHWPCPWPHPLSPQQLVPVVSKAGTVIVKVPQLYSNLSYICIKIHQLRGVQVITPSDFLHFVQPEKEEADEEEEFDEEGGWLMEPRSNQPFGGTEPWVRGSVNLLPLVSKKVKFHCKLERIISPW